MTNTSESKRASILIPTLANIVIKIIALKSSTSGYWIEIGALQYAHSLPKNIYDKSGILCQGFSFVPHFGQCEAGNITLSPFGILAIRTFINEPITSPKSAMKIQIN